MKLAPGNPLDILLLTDEAAEPQHVGRLAMAYGVAQLEWSAEAISAGHALSPLHYPLETGLHAARTREFGGLHGFLADSLPDAWGALLLKRRLQKLGHRYEDLNPVDRLALVGSRGRGALTFRPATLDAGEGAGAIDLDLLADEARQVLLGEEGELDALLVRLGGGSGGARPKVHVGIAADGGLRAGDELAGEGASSSTQEWIVKFPALIDPADIGPVEEAYARMARAAGIEMAETRLIPSEGRAHFATRRFDRPSPGQRLHMVSLGGAVEASPHMPSLDYDGFLRAVLAITRDVRDGEQAFRRMVFNVLAHNRDDHVRQHAFLMDEEGVWSLAPAFDLTYSHGPGGEHYMAVMGEGRDIARAHVEALGERHGIAAKRIAAIVDEVRAALADWDVHATTCGVDLSHADIGEALAWRDREFAA